MAENRIGDFQFLALHGAPVGLSEQLLVLSRPSVDGVAIWKLGRRGRPFSLRSVVDATSFEAARAMHDRYLGLKGADPVDLVWSDIELTTEKIMVAVLDVRPVPGRTRSMLTLVGGLNPPSLGWVECDWDLIAVGIAPNDQAA